MDLQSITTLIGLILAGIGLIFASLLFGFGLKQPEREIGG
jgi:hypothetical protein